MAIFEIENNNDQAHANTAFFNTKTNGQLSDVNDVDYYKFNYSQFSLIGIKFTSITGYKVELIQNGSVLLSTVNGDKFTDLTINNLPPETFYIAVTADATAFTTTPYDFTVFSKPFVIVPGEEEPNDTISTPSTIPVGLGTKVALISKPTDTVVLGNLSDANDKDYYTFHADQAGLYQIDFTPGNTTVAADTNQHFYKVSVIKYVNNVETVLSSYFLDTSEAHLGFNAQTSGDYYLLIENGGSNSPGHVNTQLYEIEINPVDPDSTVFVSATVDGSEVKDYMTGTIQNEIFKGNAGNDIIFAKGGNDSIDGGLGNDTMLGGVGNDIYVVSSFDDKVIENLNEGTDQINSDVSYILSANLENLKLNATNTAVSATGNAKNNILIGNNLNNNLIGKDGNDSLDGGTSTKGDNLIGGTGDDYYVINSTLDKITEDSTTLVANAGSSDTAFTKVSGYVLALYVENLLLDEIETVKVATGNSGNNTITGNSFLNKLMGGDGNDTILAGAGNDQLIGGTGNDQLTGGIGSDTFVFESALSETNNIDLINDFSSQEDSIYLDTDLFTKFKTAGELSSTNFHIGTTASADSDDYIIYDNSTGFLYYDANRTDNISPIHFATISNLKEGSQTIHADLLASDIVFGS